MSLRSWLIDMLDGSPRYADQRDVGEFYNDLPMTTLSDLNHNNDAWAGFLNHHIHGLPVVSEKTALTISAVYACVNLIAGAISVMPMNLFRRAANDEREPIHGDDLWWLLNEEFLPRWSAANGWEYLVLSLLFHGDAFARIIRDRNGKIMGLEPFHPVSVQVIPTPDRMRLVYAVSPGNRQLEVYDQDDMLHVSGFGFDGTRGLSPLRHHLSMTGSVALATQEFAGRFFANGARPDIVITAEQPLNKEKAGEIADNWSARYGGLENSHKPAVLGHGAKVTNLTFSSEEAQLLAMRQFQTEEIARIYGVPPWMIGHMQKTTSFGAGVETMGTAFVRFTLRQHLNKFEREINRKFFRTKARFAEFDTFELERADMKNLFESFSKAIGSPGAPGFMTPDEVRQKLNMKPKGGDAAELFSGNQPAPVDPKGGADAQEPTALPAQK